MYSTSGVLSLNDVQGDQAASLLSLTMLASKSALQTHIPSATRLLLAKTFGIAIIAGFGMLVYHYSSSIKRVASRIEPSKELLVKIRDLHKFLKRLLPSFLRHNGGMNIQTLPTGPFENILSYLGPDDVMAVSKRFYNSASSYQLIALTQRMNDSLSSAMSPMTGYEFKVINKFISKIDFESNDLMAFGQPVETRDTVWLFVKAAFSLASVGYPIDCAIHFVDKIRGIANNPDNLYPMQEAVWAKMQLLLQGFFQLFLQRNWGNIKGQADEILGLASVESGYLDQARLISSFASYFIIYRDSELNEVLSDYQETLDLLHVSEHVHIFESIKGFIKYTIAERQLNVNLRNPRLSAIIENNTIYPYVKGLTVYLLALRAIRFPLGDEENRVIIDLLKIHIAAESTRFHDHHVLKRCFFQLRLKDRISEEECPLTEVVNYVLNYCLNSQDAQTIFWAKNTLVYLGVYTPILQYNDIPLSYAKEIVAIHAQQGFNLTTLRAIYNQCWLMRTVCDYKPCDIAILLKFLDRFEGELKLHILYLDSIFFLSKMVIDGLVSEEHVSSVRVLELIEYYIHHTEPFSLGYFQAKTLRLKKLWQL